MASGKAQLRALPGPNETDATSPPRGFRLQMPVTDAGRRRLHNLTIAFDIIVGLIVFAWAGPRFEGDVGLFTFLLLLNLVAERMPISIYGESTITVGYVFTLPIIAIFGAPGAALLAPLESLVRRAGRHPLDLRFAQSACRGVSAYVLAAAVYGLIAPIGADSPSLSMVAAAVAATATTFVTLAAFVTWNRALRSGEALSEVWANHKWVALHYAGFGAVGTCFTIAYLSTGYWGIIAYLVPVLTLRLAMKQYVDKTADNVSKLKTQNDALKTANIEISRISSELSVAYGATLEALVNALEARDQETKGHSVRVAHYMLNIAEALGVRPGTQQYVDMQHGALLHDVGKIGVRDAVLLKPGALTPEEWELMRKHPEIGYHILREVKFLQGSAEIVLAHHERWDGAGYPFGLKGEDIPLGSRIFAVVDTFDTMTSDRVYRAALKPEDALEEILRCSGSQFDPTVVEAFLDIYDDWLLEREKLHAGPVTFRAAA